MESEKSGFTNKTSEIWRKMQVNTLKLARMSLPDVQKHVYPVEDNVGDLRGEPDVLQEVHVVGDGVATCVVHGQLVVDEILVGEEKEN